MGWLTSPLRWPGARALGHAVLVGHYQLGFGAWGLGAWGPGGLGAWGPGGLDLMKRFARASRKWNARVLLSSQIPADFLSPHPGFRDAAELPHRILGEALDGAGVVDAIAACSGRLRTPAGEPVWPQLIWRLAPVNLVCW